MSVGTVDGDSEPSVEVSKVAAEQALALMDQEGMDTEVGGLRLFVQQGGCAGLSYGMRFDNEPEPDDTVTIHHDLRVFVDPASMNYIGGSRLETKTASKRLASTLKILTSSLSVVVERVSAHEIIR